MIFDTKHKIIILLFIVGLLQFSVYAQEPIGEEPPAIQALGTATKDAILLRWAVSTPLAWKYANQYGFTIERKTIARGDSLLKTPEVKILTSMPILPKPMMEWESFTEQNDHAAIAAQALYGEEFGVAMEQGGDDIISILNRAQVLEQRFAFALLAADQNYEVAQYSGLAFTDTTVQQGERYLYRIRSAIPTEKMVVAHGGVYLGLSDYRPLPQPIELVGIFKDHTTMLTWNYTLLKKQYTSYIVERSTDGKTFSPLDAVPVTNMSERKKNPSDRLFYVDSLPQNNTTYHYRVKGISPFGQVGPPSKVIAGKGRKVVYFNPAITAGKLQSDNTSAVLTWEFPEEGMESLAYFQLNRSETPKGNYNLVHDNISKNTRTITYSPLETINYFSITAVSIDSTKRVSFPQMVQPVDDTPPAVPTLLKGTIDSTGVVQLQWQQNTEKDFQGYRVFRALRDKDEYTQITFEPEPKSAFIDTINIKTLNSKVYYKIKAFDKRYNGSVFSDTLTLIKPDLIPPTQPVFNPFKVENGQVVLDWIPSSSLDAKQTLVYRKEKGSTTAWELISGVPLPEHQYTDTNVTHSIPYLYTLLSKDESGLESEPITPLQITVPDNLPKAEIKTLDASVDRTLEQITLTWKYKVEEVIGYTLYKALGEEKLTIYKEFDSDSNTVVDTQLQINSTYTYAVQAVFVSGAVSPIKTIQVTY